MDYIGIFEENKEPSLFGRYITLNNIEKLIKNNPNQIIGYSVKNKPIYKIEIGTGKKKILLWSQMHGNESTTTKAIFDFINLLNNNSELSSLLLRYFTFCFIPMLNPDGSELYTRENANEVDLNRDSKELTQPESKALRKEFEEFKPDFCYNLHDQRTIFGAGDTGNPATVSFLSPSYDEDRNINEVRLESMNVIVAVNNVLQKYIPNQVGRFDDSFNINCIGDTFQSLNVPTILFEAGHYQNDYQREESRKYIFISLLASFLFIEKNVKLDNFYESYLGIPQNKVNFYDFIYRNVKINYDGNEKITNFAAHYKEVLNNNQIDFQAYIAKVGDLDKFHGHFEYDAQGKIYNDMHNNIPLIDQKVDFCLDKNVKFINGLLKN